MEKIYNKLIRDKIPEIIIEDNKTPVYRVLDDVEYKTELERKLLEEYKEMLESTNSKERVAELSDILEIVISLSKIEGLSIEELLDESRTKTNERGGFDKKLFLEKVIYNE